MPIGLWPNMYADIDARSLPSALGANQLNLQSQRLVSTLGLYIDLGARST
jgi:hypothetical protein